MRKFLSFRQQTQNHISHDRFKPKSQIRPGKRRERRKVKHTHAGRHAGTYAHTHARTHKQREREREK